MEDLRADSLRDCDEYNAEPIPALTGRAMALALSAHELAASFGGPIYGGVCPDGDYDEYTPQSEDRD